MAELKLETRIIQALTKLRQAKNDQFRVASHCGEFSFNPKPGCMDTWRLALIVQYNGVAAYDLYASAQQVSASRDCSTEIEWVLLAQGNMIEINNGVREAVRYLGSCMRKTLRLEGVETLTAMLSDELQFKPVLFGANSSDLAAIQTVTRVPSNAPEIILAVPGAEKIIVPEVVHKAPPTKQPLQRQVQRVPQGQRPIQGKPGMAKPGQPQRRPTKRPVAQPAKAPWLRDWGRGLLAQLGLAVNSSQHAAR